VDGKPYCIRVSSGVNSDRFPWHWDYTATFKRPIEKWTKKLGKNEVKILELMKENKYVTTKEFSEHIKISTTLAFPPPSRGRFFQYSLPSWVDIFPISLPLRGGGLRWGWNIFCHCEPWFIRVWQSQLINWQTGYRLTKLIGWSEDW